MKICLVRHTAVDVAPGICYGQSDVPLKNTFEEEAQVVKERLLGQLFDKVYSSPLSRCTRLAHYCGYAEVMELSDQLKELDFGYWEMHKWDQVDMSFWESDWVKNSPPNGESFQQMYNRIAAFLHNLKRKNYSSVLIFTHGGVINCVRVYMKEATLENTFSWKPPYGVVVEFELE